MEELTSLIRKNGETLDCNDWNKLVIAINTVISFYNAYPTKLSEFENDSEFVSYNSVVAIVLELIQNGIIPSTEGLDGKSAYLIAVDNGFSGTELLWLASLQGEVGKSAYLLAVLNGFTGTTLLWLLSLKGLNGLDGQNGLNGKSAFELAVEEGFEGTLLQWLDSLKGEDGTPGQDGSNGINGTNGKSAYELAVERGYEGTLELWLLSLHGLNGTNGQNGINGKSAYQSYLDTTTDNPPLTELQWSANASNGSSRFTDENEEITYNVNSNNHDYVDLCLPSGTLWSSMNLGASSILDEGLWYTWGGLQGYTLQLIDGHHESFPYNSLNVEILPIESDAARQTWGGDWEVPTENQAKELVTYTTKEVVQIEGIKVLKLTSKLNSEKYIYFPLSTNIIWRSTDYIILSYEESYHFAFSIWLKEGEYYKPSDSLTIYADGKKFEYGPRYSNGRYLIYSRDNLNSIRPIINNSDGQHRRLQEICFTGSYNDLFNKPTIPDALIQSDWNLADNTKADYIKNKPTIPQTPVQSDWYQTDNTQLDYIRHKPTIPAAQVQSDWNASSGMGEILNKPSLAAVATTGAYSDLSGTPVIPTVPTKVSDFINDCPYATFNVDTISNNYDYVEIGGVYWATKNVGASSITDVGLYFEYADSNGYTQSLIGIDKNFSKSDSVHYERIQEDDDSPLWAVINADRLNSSQNRINSQYDGSSVNMGGTWRIPTKKELKSLFDNSYLIWYSNYNNSGIGGIIFRDKTKSSHSIFIPFSGYARDGLIESLNSICFWIQDFTDPFFMCGRCYIREQYLSQDMTEGVEFDINDSRYYSSSSSSNASLYYGITIRPVLDVSKNIANVAITGNYNDLSNKPTIPTVPSNETAASGGSTLSVVTTGDKYNWNNKASIWSGTQAQYDALSPNYDSNTIYIITAAS